MGGDRRPRRRKDEEYTDLSQNVGPSRKYLAIRPPIPHSHPDNEVQMVVPENSGVCREIR